MYFGTSKFIAVRLMSLLYFDRLFHVRMDVAMIGIGTRFPEDSPDSSTVFYPHFTI